MSEEIQTKVEDFEDDDDESESFIGNIVGNLWDAVVYTFYIMLILVGVYCFKQFYNESIPLFFKWLSSHL